MERNKDWLGRCKRNKKAMKSIEEDGWLEMEMEERVNAKMLKLIIENKELKRRLVECTTLQKEWN